MHSVPPYLEHRTRTFQIHALVYMYPREHSGSKHILVLLVRTSFMNPLAFIPTGVSFFTASLNMSPGRGSCQEGGKGRHSCLTAGRSTTIICCTSSTYCTCLCYQYQYSIDKGILRVYRRTSTVKLSISASTSRCTHGYQVMYIRI